MAGLRIGLFLLGCSGLLAFNAHVLRVKLPWPVPHALRLTGPAVIHAGQRACVRLNLVREEEEPTVEELKAELLELVGEISNRGLDADADDATDIADIVSELESAQQLVDWQRRPEWGGRWRLRYTSSRAFHANQGLIGYSRDVKGLTTPELFMSVQPQYRFLTFEEPIAYEEGSLVGFFGKVTKADAVLAECTWRATPDGMLSVTPVEIVVGERKWEPYDRQARALRVLSATSPIYIDDMLLVVRAQLAEVVFIFERVR